MFHCIFVIRSVETKIEMFKLSSLNQKDVKMMDTCVGM